MGSTAATSAGRRRAARRATAAGARTKPNRGRGAARRNGSGGARRSTRARSRAAGNRRRDASRRPSGNARTRWTRRLTVGAGILAAIAAGYFLWLRDSSLVAVTDVTVSGVESDDRKRITNALTRAGEEMTTLNVDAAHLESAVARFPTVESVRASASFPHGLEIDVVERPPALAARAGEAEVAVAADGTLLPGVEADENLLRLEVDQLPSSDRLNGGALAQALVVGAAPEPLRPLIRRIGQSREFGVEARMRGGIMVRFGSGANAATKWAAASALLADPQLEVLTYVDVRVPERPAAGGVP